jgi:non-ribosomal peptide synthetase component F
MNPSTQKFIDSDLKLRPLKPEITSAKFDLTLSIEEIDGTLQGCLEYNSDLFKRSTIENLSNHYISLIESMVNNPYKPVLENSLLSLDEYDQITKGFNPPLMQGCPTSAQVLFENIAKNQPEAIALTFQNTCLSYEKLNQLINKHARVLRELGVKSEVVVGILFEPCLEMVITMLAILKAGGAYLPILSSTPKERVDAMLQGSSAQLMIYQKKLFDIEISTEGLLKSYDSLDYKKYSSENPSWINLPDSLAYIIFTSVLTYLN